MDGNLTLFGRKKIRPAKSPTRFGVKKLMVAPANIALKLSLSDMCHSCITSNRHLMASMPQLTNIRTVASKI